jgi:hypothetical protein
VYSCLICVVSSCGVVVALSSSPARDNTASGPLSPSGGAASEERREDDPPPARSPRQTIQVSAIGQRYCRRMKRRVYVMKERIVFEVVIGEVEMRESTARKRWGRERHVNHDQPIRNGFMITSEQRKVLARY